MLICENKTGFCFLPPNISKAAYVGIIPSDITAKPFDFIRIFSILSLHKSTLLWQFSIITSILSPFSIEDFIPSATLLYKLSSSCFNTKIFDEKPEIGNKTRKEKQEKNSGIKILV